MRLFEGNRDALDPIELAPEVPHSSAEAEKLGSVEAHEHHPAPSGGSGPGDLDVALRKSGGRDPAHANIERFFRAVDRAVIEYHSKPSGLPLILVSLTDNEDIFRRVTHNAALLPETIRHDPGSLSTERLRQEAWQVVQPYFLERLSRLVEKFGEARSKRHASADLSDIGPAAMSARVATLLVEAERVVPGTLDPATGRIDLGKLSDPHVDDLLDELAELVLRNGGETIVVPAERMPTDSGAAAIYRY